MDRSPGRGIDLLVTNVKEVVRDRETTDDPKSFSHRFAQTNGIRTHYVEEGQGRLVILLHGFPYLWYMWRGQIHALAAAGYR